MSKELLERTKQFCNECNATNSINEKVEIIRKYPDLQPIFKATLDVINYQYGITSNNLIKLKNLDQSKCNDYNTIFDLLNALSSRKITGHEAASNIWKFILKNIEYKDIIINILDRNLKTRTDASLINRVYPGCVPVFNVELANECTEKLLKKIDFHTQRWYASRKLDGARCLAIIYDNGNCKLFSRQGKEFLTLNKVKEEIEKLKLSNIVLDGEICLIDNNDKENFQDVMKEIRKKNHTIQNPRFKMFSCVSREGFESGTCKVMYSSRLNLLRNIIPKNNNILSILDQVEIIDIDHLNKLKDIALKSGWEGLIIRIDCCFENGRSNNMLKVKAFKDAEYKVEDIEMGPVRYIDKKTGLEKEEVMMSNVVIHHKNNPVKVGSGFSLEDRMYFYKNPDKLIGKIITVKYFEESKNENGQYSLRFPTCKVIHGDERNT